MFRPLLCLPLCLLLASDRPTSPPETKPPPPTVSQDALPDKDPVAFLVNCLERYNQRGIKGYTLVMQKQERIGGVLQPTEVIEVCYRAEPHSVFMKWIKGQRKANRVLYVEGENNGKVLANPAGIAGALIKVAERDPEGEDAKQSGRYPVTQFGLKRTAMRSVKAWTTAQEKGRLRFEYLGIRKVREAGDRLCYTLRRTCDPPEEDGVVEVTLYIDKELGLQVGSVAKGEGGKLLGEYFYRDIRLNPEFKPEQFQRAALTD